MYIPYLLIKVFGPTTPPGSKQNDHNFIGFFKWLIKNCLGVPVVTPYTKTLEKTKLLYFFMASLRVSEYS